MKFKKAAQKATSTSKVMEGKVKIDIDDIIRAYPEGITIDAVDILQGTDGDFAVCGFIEDPNAFFFGGSVLTSVVKEWVNMFGGDCEQTSAELAAEGGCKVILAHAKSKNGRGYTSVVVPD